MKKGYDKSVYFILNFAFCSTWKSFNFLKLATMKICKILLLVTLSLFTVSVYAQNKTNKKNKATAKQEVATKYYCPMKCEGDKTYDKAGKCPKCGMNLKEVKAAAVTYSCPMKCEGDRKYDKAGTCPKCGMNLKEDKVATLTYSCPMKCEGDRKYDKPGKCPKCGMALTQPKKTEG